MKFQNYVTNVELEAPQQYRGKFISYSALKQRTGPGSTFDSQTDAAFFADLLKDLHLVNRVFVKQASAVLQKNQKLSSFRWCWLCFYMIGSSPEESGQNLLHESHWCQKYAVINAAILKKLLRKYDTKHNSSKGREILQDCWQSNNLELGAVLHSPLLEELKALDGNIIRRYQLEDDSVEGGLNWVAHQNPSYSQSACEEQRSRSMSSATGGREIGCSANLSAIVENKAEQATGDDLMDELASRVPSSWSRVDMAVLPAASTGPLEDLKCSVCLGTFYKPVGLSCGHRFCQPCILASVGLRHVLGPTSHILRLIPDTAQCPQCRQGQVFGKLEILQQLGKLSKFSDPESWKAREEEDLEWQQYLRREVQCGNPNKLPIVNTGF